MLIEAKFPKILMENEMEKAEAFDQIKQIVHQISPVFGDTEAINAERERVRRVELKASLMSIFDSGFTTKEILSTLGEIIESIE